MTTATFTLPEENSTITNALNEFAAQLDMPVTNIEVMFDHVLPRGYGQYYAHFNVQFEYLWMDDEDLQPYNSSDDFTISIHTTSVDYYERLCGIDEDGNYNGRVADAAEIQFIENNMEKILESIHYRLDGFFKELG